MIVVLGCPAARVSDGTVAPAGLAGWIAVRAAAEGASVQLVGRMGDDDLGDAVVLALARAGVGHAALLRDATRPTAQIAADEGWPDDAAAVLGENTSPGGSLPVTAAAAGPTLDAADVALGLRYLTEFSVLVIAEPLAPSAGRAAVEAAAFAGARTVAVVDPGGEADAAAGSDAAARADDVVEAPVHDREAFAAVIGRYAAALDRGEPPADAFASAVRGGDWTPVDGGSSARS